MAVEGRAILPRIQFPMPILHRSAKRLLGAVSALNTAALRNPREKMLKARTLAPDEPEELCCTERVHVSAEKCFKSPSNIRAGPRTQSVAFRGIPVVAQSSEQQAGYFQPSRARSEVICATWWRPCQA